MRKTFYVACTLLLVLGLWVGGALAYTFNDTTDVEYWNSGAPTSAGWTDVIGTPNTFDTFGANLSGSTFTIFTNWNPDKNFSVDAAVVTADFFIYKGSNVNPDFAIQLNTFSGTGNVYTNPSYYTSDDIFKTLTGLTYGGQYDKFNPQLVPTQVTSTTAGSTTSVVWTIGSGLNNQVDINLTGLGLTGPWKFVWGTATCSNDGFSAVVPAPIPGTLVLLGSALISLAGAGLRKKKLV